MWIDAPIWMQVQNKAKNTFPDGNSASFMVNKHRISWKEDKECIFCILVIYYITTFYYLAPKGQYQ